MKKIIIAQMVCFYFLAASLSIPCYGEDVKVKFSGNVSFVGGLQSVFTIGRPFDVTISYNTEIPLTTLSSTRGLYENAITLLTFNYDNGSYVGTASGLDISISNDGPYGVGDRFSFSFEGADMVSFPSINGESLRLDYSSYLILCDNVDNTAINSFELPTTQDFFDSPAFYDHYNNIDRFNLSFSNSPSDTFMHGVAMEINSGTIIPEPTTVSLLAIGGLALLRKRK